MGVETASISCVLVPPVKLKPTNSSPECHHCRNRRWSKGRINQLSSLCFNCTPIGDLFLEEPEVSPVVACARVHEDLVYCSRRKVFTSVSPCTLKFPRFLLDDNRDDVTMKKLGVYHSESCDWDIEDPASAKLVRTAMLMCCEERGPTLNWLEENIEILEKQCLHIPHLVYAEESDQLFLVLHFVMLMNPHEGGRPLGYILRCEVKGVSEVFPCKTFGFIVMRMDEDKTAVYKYNSCTILDDLNGMSMVVGIVVWEVDRREVLVLDRLWVGVVTDPILPFFPSGSLERIEKEGDVATDDALYGTFDIYLKTHPGLSKQERERLFLVIERAESYWQGHRFAKLKRSGWKLVAKFHSLV